MQLAAIGILKKTLFIQQEGAGAMYHEKIMNLYQKSINRGLIDDANFASQKANPSCGDEISFTGLRDDDMVIQMKYEGSGCIISQAAASLLCDLARGKTIAQIKKITSDDLLAELRLILGPNRMQCIQLPVQVLQDALNAE